MITNTGWIKWGKGGSPDDVRDDKLVVVQYWDKTFGSGRVDEFSWCAGPGHGHIIAYAVLDVTGPARFRAGRGEEYWRLDQFGKANVLTEEGDDIDNRYHEVYNYFRTKEQAEAVSALQLKLRKDYTDANV